MGGQYHHELMKYCPPSYVLCVSSHFWPFNIVKFVLEKLDKNLGSADPPPPSVGQKSQIFPKIRFEGFPYPPFSPHAHSHFILIAHSHNLPGSHFSSPVQPFLPILLSLNSFLVLVNLFLTPHPFSHFAVNW